MDLVVLLQPEVCVEIGVFTGYSFLPIVTTLAFLDAGSAYAIDPWSNAEAVRGIPKMITIISGGLPSICVKLFNNF